MIRGPAMSSEGPVFPAAADDTRARQDKSSRRSPAISFGIFRLDLRSGRLLRGVTPIPLRPKTWAVLQYRGARTIALT